MFLTDQKNIIITLIMIGGVFAVLVREGESKNVTMK